MDPGVRCHGMKARGDYNSSFALRAVELKRRRVRLSLISNGLSRLISCKPRVCTMNMDMESMNVTDMDLRVT